MTATSPRRSRCAGRGVPGAGRAVDERDGDFTTHHRQESGQTARVLASFNGGTPTLVRGCTSDVVAQPRSLTLDVPARASSVSFRFHYTGSNNWYWVIDGVEIRTS